MFVGRLAWIEAVFHPTLTRMSNRSYSCSDAWRAGAVPGSCQTDAVYTDISKSTGSTGQQISRRYFFLSSIVGGLLKLLLLQWQNEGVLKWSSLSVMLLSYSDDTLFRSVSVFQDGWWLLLRGKKKTESLSLHASDSLSILVVTMIEKICVRL